MNHLLLFYIFLNECHVSVSVQSSSFCSGVCSSCGPHGSNRSSGQQPALSHPLRDHFCGCAGQSQHQVCDRPLSSLSGTSHISELLWDRSSVMVDELQSLTMWLKMVKLLLYLFQSPQYSGRELDWWVCAGVEKNNHTLSLCMNLLCWHRGFSICVMLCFTVLKEGV